MNKAILVFMLGVALALPAAQAAAEGFGEELGKIELPNRVYKIPKVYVTADELANPDQYYPAYDGAYVEPPSYLPPPPPGPIVRPGEFEIMDSVVIAIVNYGSDFLYMWAEMLNAYGSGGHTYVIAEQSLQAGLAGLFDGEGVDASTYSFLNYPLNTIWVRDFGPEFARETGSGQRHIFDAYYTGRPLDDAIPGQIANSDWINSDGSALPINPTDHMLSGGNIMADGAGTCFFSDIVYSYEEKPSSWSVEDVDTLMKDYLGCEQIIALKPICQDATGHIDLYSKLMGRHGLLLGEFPADTYFTGTNPSNLNGHCDNDAYPNDYQDQEDNLATIQATTNLDGEPWEVTRMPMLEPYFESDGGYSSWVYRSYMNSQAFNGVVAMPSYYDLQPGETDQYLLDMEALAIAAYEEASPNPVTVVPIDSDHIIGMAGAIHCITHEIPAEEGWEDYTEPGDDEPDAGPDGGDGGGESDESCGCSSVGGGSNVSLLSILFS